MYANCVRSALWALMLSLIISCAPSAPSVPTQAPPLAGNTVAPSPAATAASSAPTVSATATPSVASPKTGGTLRIALDFKVSSVDPINPVSQVNTIPLIQVMRSLFFSSANYQPVPDLAKSYQVSDDGLTWTFQLRDDVKFHSGQPFSAKDVAYTMNYIKDPNTKSLWAGLFSTVKSVDTPSDYTVVLHLSQPNGILPWLLQPVSFGIVPQGFTSKDRPIGTGPFRFVEWRADGTVVLAKNPDYYKKGEPLLDQLIFQSVPDATTRLAGLKSGDLDWIRGVTPFQAPALQADKSFTVNTIVSTGFNYLSYNTKRPPFDDVRVRRALAMAIDKKAVEKAVSQGLGTVAETPLAPSVPIPLSVKPLGYDTNGAKALLQQAGVSNLNFTLLTFSPFDDGQRMGEVIIDQWSKIGVTAKFQALEDATFTDQTLKHNYDVFLSGFYSQSDPDAKVRNNMMCASPRNYSQWCNADFDKLIDQAVVPADLAQRGILYSKAFQILIDEQPWTYLTWQPNIVAMRSTVHGYYQLPVREEYYDKVWKE